MQPQKSSKQNIGIYLEICYWLRLDYFVMETRKAVGLVLGVVIGVIWMITSPPADINTTM